MCKKVLCVCTPIVLCILLIFTSCLSKNDTDDFGAHIPIKRLIATTTSCMQSKLLKTA